MAEILHPFEGTVTEEILAPANGKPIITPTQDMVLGIYYLTILKDQNAPVKGYFHDFMDAISAYELGNIKLHDKIVVRDDKGERIETTVGRIIFNETLRKSVLQ